MRRKRRINLVLPNKRKPRHNGWGYILNYRNAPVVGRLAGGAVHLQSCQTFLTTPASTVLAEASRGVKIVTLSPFHPPIINIAAGCHAEGQESPTVDLNQAAGN